MRTIAYKCTCKTYKQINELLWLTKYNVSKSTTNASFLRNMLPFKLFIYHILCHSNTRISTSFGNFHQASFVFEIFKICPFHTLYLPNVYFYNKLQNSRQFTCFQGLYYMMLKNSLFILLQSQWTFFFYHHMTFKIKI